MARPSKLSNATLEALTAELERRQKALPKLEAKAAELRAALEEVEAEIAMLGGSEAPKRRGRKAAAKKTRRARRGRPARAAAKGRGSAKRGKKTGRRRGRPAGAPGTLFDAVKQVTGSTPMSPKEIREAIVAKGLKKESKTMGTQISQVLSKNKIFKQKGRAQWVKAG